MQDTEKGLSEQEVIMSRERFGENRLREYKRKSFFKCFLSNLGDPIIKVLIGALFINVIFMFPRINWFESGGILCSIIIATLVSTFSEYSSENTFEKLRNQSENITAVVKRAGGVCEINSQEVVVGDIYTVSAGNMVVADGVIIDGQVHLDESALSGESREVIKGKGEKIYKGSLALGGGCDTRVEAVGEGTYYGRIARELKCDSRPSPLKNRLSHLAKSISRLGYLLAGIIAIAYLFNVFFIDTGFDMSKTVQLAGDIKFLLSKLLYALTLAVSIVVVAVPEGLPMMITVVLSSNMKRMMQDNVLVKRLVGIETSGNINLLFTDKTGTLTEGKLRVKELIGAQGISFGSLSALKNAPNYRKYVTLCASFCNEAKISKGKAVGSDATDRCLKEYFKDEKISARVIDRQSFDSAKKYSSATVEWQDERVVLYKGAPEKLLSWSNKYLSKEGIALPFDRKTRTELEGRLCDLGSRAYRVVALAYENGADVVFVALVAIRDRIRKEVPRAVAEVQGAGIGVVMITGDNESTAEAIAKECGIISPQTQRSLVLNGAYLEKITDEELTELMPKIAVIARALPSDKSRLVRLAQNSGYVVGMTGDGINDAPSLKSADVGFGMGSGTEVAKEACDIVISNNNFASIVKAILYGRTIFESIRKFIVFQLIMNFAAVGISLLGPFIGVDNPVTVTQMLWVNIIMDTLGALAFAREPHLKEYMKQKPRSSTEQIISKRMVEQIALTAAYVLILCIWFLKSDTLPLILLKGDDRYILSAFFAMFIFTGVFTCFTARTTRLNIFAGIGKNKSFLAIMLSISIVQMAFIYFGGDTFRATPLYLSDLFKVILISFTVVIFDLLRKIGFKLLRKKNKGENKC